MSNINYSKNSKVVKYGNYTEEYIGPGEIETTVLRSINIDTFYRLYLKLNNVIGVRRQGSKIIETKLPDTPIELLIHLMKKDGDFTIVFRNKDATLVKLGEELGKSASSIYATLSKLRKAGYIIKDEDNLFVLNSELRDLIKLTRKVINEGEPLKFDFLFKFCVTER